MATHRDRREADRPLRRSGSMAEPRRQRYGSSCPHRSRHRAGPSGDLTRVCIAGGSHRLMPRPEEIGRRCTHTTAEMPHSIPAAVEPTLLGRCCSVHNIGADTGRCPAESGRVVPWN